MKIAQWNMIDDQIVATDSAGTVLVRQPVARADTGYLRAALEWNDPNGDFDGMEHRSLELAFRLMFAG
jgi:hypothetical protein